jgi:uncharacterized membrane protein
MSRCWIVHDIRRSFISIGLIRVIIFVIFLSFGFSGRFGGYGYVYGHTGIGVIPIVLAILALTGRI